MTEKKKVTKAKKKKPSAKKKVGRGRPKGSVNKKRGLKTKQKDYLLPIEEKFTYDDMLKLVNFVNQNSKSKRIMGAATDGNRWWLAFV